ncbi:DUF554 domain-containing protein [Anaerolentibacter hominis]|uniref:DUF554 domain-containing protein n=1 Tax=Anaerolentibacter hominis TaxID=3079009 RepID=UPI0031B83476
MIGLGTIINTAGIIIGGLIGLLFGRFITKRFQDTLMKATGVCVMFVGMGGVMEKMLAVSGDRLTSGGALMMIGSLAIGSLLGEWLNIDLRMEQFGEWLKIKTGNSGDAKFVEGFVTASLTICIGAMAVVGSIQDGLTGEYSVLALKAVLDLIIILIMTSSLGKGCIFAAIPVAVFQGSVTLLARLIEPLMIPAALDNLSFVGSILIFCVGVNLIWEKKFKVVNMLPSIVVAVIWALIASL